ncbi:molybdate ABC transporter substrate-binding protein [Pseudorhodoplanes sinuspersici]|uniref:Molybdenum ABC transporter substrate-binding protein n=1 Tax=Pseudorhodoplanes sinuspersici TaxID=1235591 RepID=A0A1W6ZSD2_9HYPH|nr:substrate-binding domain-containing protein [Pseudorhodoplanes sinuspersici]ARQ00272.1 molybdenum ABC transporter substrate-binding protein [Pseudorhodoplanes sinuspersici]RKE67573.1 molybdate transport system substrate-binding protein [Pseudorhodoplanes sinuspersici]
MSPRILLFFSAILTVFAAPASAAELKILTAGAMKQVVLALQPDFEKQGHKLVVDNDTAGALLKRIENGEAFDIAVVTPGVVDQLAAKGKLVSATKTNLARVAIGVMVRPGAPLPNISSVDAFKQALMDAKSVAYIDPASGGSSGIYLDKLFEKMGIADAVRAKAKLKRGGYVADLLVSGDAELGIHQISEIVPVKGVALVGPLPPEIQNYTTYAGAISSTTKDAAAAKAFIELLAGPAGGAVLREKGMDRPAL